jgi:hypothetical protein
VPPITVSAEVERSANDVYPYTTEPSRFGEWQQGIVSGRMDPAVTVGTPRCVTVRRIGFVKRTSISEVCTCRLAARLERARNRWADPCARRCQRDTARGRGFPGNHCGRFRRPRHRQAAYFACGTPAGTQGNADQRRRSHAGTRERGLGSSEAGTGTSALTRPARHTTPGLLCLAASSACSRTPRPARALSSSTRQRAGRHGVHGQHLDTLNARQSIRPLMLLASGLPDCACRHDDAATRPR